MTTLYIIGNGFDFWHKLPTSYDLFYDFAKDTLDELESYFYIDATQGGPWSDFENCLGTYDWRLMYEAHDYTDVTAENFKPSEAFGLEDELADQTDQLVETIKEQFHAWIDEIDISVASPKMRFNVNDRFLNFNYTSTLQLVYGINVNNVHHIHGRSDVYDELVFGHLETVEEEPELDEDGNSNRTMFSDAEGAAKYPFYALQKPVNEIIEKNRTFFQSLNDISGIIVIGHSLNKIDLPYFAEVAKNAIAAKWTVCCYMPEDEIHHVNQLIKCGVKRENIGTCKYADLIV